MKTKYSMQTKVSDLYHEHGRTNRTDLKLNMQTAMMTVQWLPYDNHSGSTISSIW